MDLIENCGLSIAHEYTQILVDLIRGRSGKQTIGNVIGMKLFEHHPITITKYSRRFYVIKALYFYETPVVIINFYSETSLQDTLNNKSIKISLEFVKDYRKIVEEQTSAQFYTLKQAVFINNDF